MPFLIILAAVNRNKSMGCVCSDKCEMLTAGKLCTTGWFHAVDSKYYLFLVCLSVLTLCARCCVCLLASTCETITDFL